MREDILSGRIKPGMQLPPQKQLSQKYGVGEATASSAVARLAHEGLVVRIPGHGSFIPERLPTQHKMIDLVRMQAQSGIRDTRWILAGIEEISHAAEEKGWTPRWHHIHQDKIGKIEQLVERFAGDNGVITFYDVPLELPSLLFQRGVPVVTAFLTEGGLNEKPDFYPQITYDRRETARMATEHLVSLGYKRIGLIVNNYSRLRVVGFMDVVRQHNLGMQGEWLMEVDWLGHHFGHIYDRIQKVLESKNRPQAFCCSDRDIALMVKAAADNLGLAVPEDLALIACDEGEPVQAGQIDISTVAICRKEACRKALELFEQVRSQESRGKNPPLLEPVMMPLYLTVKDSCGAKLCGAKPQAPGESVEEKVA